MISFFKRAHVALLALALLSLPMAAAPAQNSIGPAQNSTGLAAKPVGIVSIAPADLPRLGDVRINADVVLFTIAISLASAVLFGLAPLVHAGRLAPADALRSGRTTTAGGERIRKAFIVAEMSMAIVLLVGAGLLLRSYGRLNAVGEIIERRMAERVAGDQIVPWLFHRSGRPIADFRKAWATACAAAGVPGALFHDLRRTFCHDAAEAGNDYKTIMDWTGHKKMSTFLRYRIVNLAGMKRAALRMATFRAGQAPTPSMRPLAPTAEGRAR